MEQGQLIEQCAKVADDAADGLTVIMNSPRGRTGQYDRQTRIRLRFAIRQCRRIAGQIRSLAGAPDSLLRPVTKGDVLAEALVLLQELQPTISAARDSRWKAGILSRIGALLKRS